MSLSDERARFSERQVRNVSRWEAFRQNRVIRYIFRPQSIPLLFGVTVVSTIFYHYAPAWIAVWILLSCVLQAGLFKIFDYIRTHNAAIGTVLYIAVAALFLTAAATFTRLGYSDALLGPSGSEENRLQFFVWFLTPQSVLSVGYPGYTIALFLYFTIFIASIAYYCSLVRYRVLLSFLVMIFPFAIYAKENEKMPVLSIVILLLCYFAVMIYCRQAAAGNEALVQFYKPREESRLKSPDRKTQSYKRRPEMIDSGFVKASGIFLLTALAVVLVIPKPQVEADRTFLDSMLDLTRFSDYLMNAISGFADESDGGTYTPVNYNRTLYFFKGDEPANLRVRSFTFYSYDTDSWEAGDTDRKPSMREAGFEQRGDIYSIFRDGDPVAFLEAVQYAAAADESFRDKWGLSAFPGLEIDDTPYRRELVGESETYNTSFYPSPAHTDSVKSSDSRFARIFQNAGGIFFRYNLSRSYREQFTLTYLSEQFSQSAAAQSLLKVSTKETWAGFLSDLTDAIPPNETEYAAVAQEAVRNYLAARDYAAEYAAREEIPQSVSALAHELTDSLGSDYEKASAIRDYLKYGDFVYDLEFPITDADNVETFLFENKTGVCYQFASAMAQMCRAIDLPTRYYEGYAMSTPYTGLSGDWDYAITTEQAHAFVDVYVAGYGWMSFDPTAGTDTAEAAADQHSFLSTLQMTGFFIFLGAAVVLAAVFWVVPFVRERHFRRRFRKSPDASHAVKAFTRLRRQWNAPEAMTARQLCEAQGEFLGLDLTELCVLFERALYSEQLDTAGAQRMYTLYVETYDAFKPAKRRQKRQARAERKARRTRVRAGG